MKMDIKFSPRTQELLSNMATDIFYRRHLLPRVDLIRFGIIAKEAVEQELHAELGEEKAKHFKVTIVGSNQYGLRMGVIGDNVGMMLSRGVEEHIIDASGGHAMHFEWNGEDVFFTVVDHPGIKPIENQIKGAVERGIYKAMLMV